MEELEKKIQEEMEGISMQPYADRYARIGERLAPKKPRITWKGIAAICASAACFGALCAFGGPVLFRIIQTNINK